MMCALKQEMLILLSKVLSQYQWLLNAYNVDYFLENHWDKLPKNWQKSLEFFTTNDIPLLICPSGTTGKFVFPLSLLCLRRLSFSIRSFRKQATDQSLPLQATDDDDACNSELSLAFSNEHKLPVKPLKASDHILCRKVKLKKRHEIERLCKIIPPLMTIAGDCSDIVDCGSGQGHLDRILAVCHGYRVFSIEANGDHINSASDQDNRALNALRRLNYTEMLLEDMPTKVNRFLSNDKNIEQLVRDKRSLGKHLLLGLHPCGELSNLILEQFINSDDSCCLVLACCCYMKAGLERFPMSSFVRQNVHFPLSIEAKELACHATEKFLTKFQKNDLDSLKVHGFRSCLEMLIEKFDPEKRHAAMRSVRIDSTMTFADYALKATRDLNVNIPPDVFDSDFMKPYLEQIDRVVTFYALRLLVAPIVELFILMDYQQYLSEHSQVRATFLVPLFEPTISPRNLVLIAHK